EAVERSGNRVEVERLDEQLRVAGLPPAAASEPPAQLLFDRPSLPLRLLLQSSERPQVSLRVCDLLDGCGADGADELRLQVRLADVEPEPLHLRPAERGPEAGALQRAPELEFFAGVAEAGDRDAHPGRTEPGE